MSDSEHPIRRLVTLDRVVHEPARLAVLVLLALVERADFVYLLDETGLSKGNLSSHMAKLEEHGYVMVEKAFVGKIPRTVYALTKSGSEALDEHRRSIVHALKDVPTFLSSSPKS